MRNNVIKTFALLLIAAMGVSSCSDFLDEENKTGQTAELEYSTSTGIDGLVGSCYSFLRLWGGKTASIALGDSGTDILYYGGDCGLKPLGQYSFTAEVSDETCFDSYWEAFYCAIDVCNNAIKYVPLNTNISDTQKEKYLGEVHFLRSYYYFMLVNMFGPVPYNGAPIESPSTEPTRESEEFIYGKVLEDLDIAIAYLSKNDNTKNSMRVTSTACRALKARVLLYAASWFEGKNNIPNDSYAGKNLYELAKQEADAVINSGFAKFYENTADLWLMYNEDINKNDEAIFGVHYNPDVNTKNTINTCPIRYSTGKAYNKQMARDDPKGGTMLQLAFVGLWNNSGSDLSDVFTRPTKLGTQMKGQIAVDVNDYYSRYGRGFRNYIPTVYAWNVFSKVKDTDQRYEATIRDHYDIVPGFVSKNYPLMKDTAIYFINKPYDSPEGKAAVEWGKDRYRVYTLTGGDLPLYTSTDPATAKPTEGAPANVTGFYSDGRYNSSQFEGMSVFVGLKKYEENCPDYSDNAKITPSLSERDFMLIRLAELYLIKAECQLALNDNAGSLATLNLLRSQRAIKGKDNTIKGTVTMETILDERCLELMAEAQRWFDLKRTHTLADRVKKYNAQASPLFDASKHYYRPIPYTQIQSVTNLSDTEGQGFWQNKGY